MIENHKKINGIPFETLKTKYKSLPSQETVHNILNDSFLVTFYSDHVNKSQNELGGIIMSGSTVMTSCNGSLMTNYARIGHAAQQVFPDILQDIIAIQEPHHRLYSDVTSNRYLNRNLRADEWSMINNVRTNGYVNFDIPLIYKLVRNLNLVPAPSKGWDFHIPPVASEILPGDDIERIRRTRNEILHRGNAQVSDSNLTDYFTTFKDIALIEAYLESQKENLNRNFKTWRNVAWMRVLKRHIWKV
ncbi:unnamed protein product [Mytilus edulis]|uniref:DZIP3-like HEPN domain-containing protein n=1 Tax=Mytilus edulis TaxID=6550 RepID=A0A8S3UGL6_MYTED|nr:unnamed protein product [Mytilus edulis]